MIEEVRRGPYIDTPGRYRYRCTRQAMPPRAVCTAVNLCVAVTNRANLVICLPKQSGSRFRVAGCVFSCTQLYPMDGRYCWWYTCT